MSRVHTEILVGSDGSPTAQRAVTAAGALAAAMSVPLTVATAWRREAPDGPPPSEEATWPGGGAAGAEAMWASETVADAAAAARAAGATDVHTETPEGGPADALLRLSDDRPGALVVVGSRGLDQRRERWVGNVPHQLTHHCRRDLLLIRSDTTAPRRAWEDVAIATDGSPTAALAIEHGLAVCDGLGVTPTLLTVAPDETAGQRSLDAVAAPADTPRRVVVGRDVRHLLVDSARDHDLLVLGNKGMSGPSRLLGSIANHVTHEVPTDLLLVNTTR